MDGWMNEWMDRCMDGWMDRCMDGWRTDWSITITSNIQDGNWMTHANHGNREQNGKGTKDVRKE